MLIDWLIDHRIACSKLSDSSIFVFARFQFRRSDYLGAWNTLIIVGLEFREKIYISCQKEWKSHVHMPPKNTYFEILYFPLQLFFAYKNVFFSTLLSNKLNKNLVGLPVVSASGKFAWYPDLPVLSCNRSDMMNLCDSICLGYGVLK